jgi:hypothetical protein
VKDKPTHPHIEEVGAAANWRFSRGGYIALGAADANERLHKPIA